MLTMLWNLSAALRGYLRFYMPTNRLIDWLRSPRGLRWAIPVAATASVGYLYAMGVCADLAQAPSLDWLNVLVMLCFWNAVKFAWTALVSPFWMLARLRIVAGAGCRETHASTNPSRD